ncbi:MAG: glycosyltransferase family 4 protein [Kofleriaceae bacterium]
MRVAFLTTNLDPYAGWGRYSREIVQRLPSLGISPVVLVERGSPPVALDGVEVHPVLHAHRDALRNPAVSVRDLLAARGRIAGCRYVHCLAEPHLFTAFLLAKLSRPARPLLTTAVGTYAASIVEGRWRPLFRRAYRSARTIPAISAYTGERLAEKLPELAPRIHAIPLGVTPPDEDRTFPPAASREPAFLAVGAVKRRKGTHLIVEALARLAERFPEARLYIVGDTRDTRYVDEVKRAIATHHLEARVIWLGQITEEELEAVYARVRGLVMPSLNHKQHFEGFGLVHLEANAFGVPAIGSRGCGNEDAIAHGRSGFLVAQNDIGELAEAMASLLGPADAWDRLSGSSLAFARSMNWLHTAQAYAALYDHP